MSKPTRIEENTSTLSSGLVIQANTQEEKIDFLVAKIDELKKERLVNKNGELLRYQKKLTNTLMSQDISPEELLQLEKEKFLKKKQILENQINLKKTEMQSIFEAITEKSHKRQTMLHFINGYKKKLKNLKTVEREMQEFKDCSEEIEDEVLAQFMQAKESRKIALEESIIRLFIQFNEKYPGEEHYLTEEIKLKEEEELELLESLLPIKEEEIDGLVSKLRKFEEQFYAINSEGEENQTKQKKLYRFKPGELRKFLNSLTQEEYENCLAQADEKTLLYFSMDLINDLNYREFRTLYYKMEYPENNPHKWGRYAGEFRTKISRFIMENFLDKQTHHIYNLPLVLRMFFNIVPERLYFQYNDINEILDQDDLDLTAGNDIKLEENELGIEVGEGNCSERLIIANDGSIYQMIRNADEDYRIEKRKRPIMEMGYGIQWISIEGIGSSMKSRAEKIFLESMKMNKHKHSTETLAKDLLTFFDFLSCARCPKKSEKQEPLPTIFNPVMKDINEIEIDGAFDFLRVARYMLINAARRRKAKKACRQALLDGTFPQRKYQKSEYYYILDEDYARKILDLVTQDFDNLTDKSIIQNIIPLLRNGYSSHDHISNILYRIIN